MKKSAFTLAEILITLTIIGVVASLTIPTVVNSTSKQQYVVGLKKAYSTLSQAINMYVAEHGDIESLVMCGDDIATRNECVLERLSPYLNLTKMCAVDTACWYDSERYHLGGSINTEDLNANIIAKGYSSAVLADGSMIMFNMDSSFDVDQERLGVISVDVNGAKSPNTRGRDIFEFFLNSRGVFPRGGADDTSTCEIDSTSHTTSNGCAAKILQENAMNY